MSVFKQILEATSHSNAEGAMQNLRVALALKLEEKVETLKEGVATCLLYEEKKEDEDSEEDEDEEEPKSKKKSKDKEDDDDDGEDDEDEDKSEKGDKKDFFKKFKKEVKESVELDEADFTPHLLLKKHGFTLDNTDKSPFVTKSDRKLDRAVDVYKHSSGDKVHLTHSHISKGNDALTTWRHVSGNERKGEGFSSHTLKSHLQQHFNEAEELNEDDVDQIQRILNHRGYKASGPIYNSNQPHTISTIYSHPSGHQVRHDVDNFHNRGLTNRKWSHVHRDGDVDKHTDGVTARELHAHLKKVHSVKESVELEEAKSSSVDHPAAQELHDYHFANEKDKQFHHQHVEPFVKNVQAKIKRGAYDHSKAQKLWHYSVDRTAQRHAKEYGNKGYGIFNKATRAHVAKSLSDHYHHAILAGEHGDAHVPTKSKKSEKKKD